MTSAAFVTVRLKSERLPRKALRPLMGRPLLGHLIDRLRQVPAAERIVLCTSWLPEDDPLEDFAKVKEIDCFRGHPQDVLARLTGAARRFQVDSILSCTGDNPLTDPRALTQLFRFHRESCHDYSRSQGLPLGAFGYVLSHGALEKVCRIKNTVDTEVWGGYFTQPGLFRWGTLLYKESSLSWPDLRVTVDTEDDFRLVEAIFRTLYRQGKVFGIEEVIALCRRCPRLLLLNAHVSQKPAPPVRFRPKVPPVFEDEAAGSLEDGWST